MCKPRTRVLKVRSPLRLDMQPQVQGLEVGSLWKLWICDARFRVLEDIHPAECGHVIPCIWSGKESPWIPQEFDPRYRVKKRLLWKLFMCDPTCSFWEVESHFRL